MTSVLEHATSQRDRLSVVAAGLMAGAGAVLVYSSSMTGSSVLPSCPLHAATGLYCPGCGATRSLHALLHGNVASAFTYNPLFFCALPFLAFYAYRWAQWAYVPHTRKPYSPQVSARIGYLIAGLLVSFMALRNIPVAPFDYLAPHAA